jgi:Flp pilus assembly protein TadG
MTEVFRSIRRALTTRGSRGQRGSATVFMLGFAAVLMVGAGLVVDGGLALNKRSQLTDDAEQAARAGANAIDLAALRDRGELIVDPGQARAVAAGFLAERGYTNISVTVTGNQVFTSAESTADTAILGLVGIGSFTVRGDAVAEPETGIG